MSSILVFRKTFQKYLNKEEINMTVFEIVMAIFFPDSKNIPKLKSITSSEIMF